MSVNEICDKGGPILEENAMEMLKIEEKCTWDNLPNELKVMCIEKTDIKTRANLMLSNRHNKMLVESIKSKHQLSYVYFEAVRAVRRRQRYNETFRFAVKSCRSTADYTSNKYEPRKLMDVLLNANIDKLELKCAAFADVMVKRLIDALATCNKKFSVKSLHLTVTHWFDFDLLRRCNEQLEQISVAFHDLSYFYDLRTLLEIPQVIAAKRLTILFLGYDSDHRLRTIIDWLLVDVDHDIGKEIIYQCQLLFWSPLVEMTESRKDFHHPTERIICLRPSNPSKRVWAWESKDPKSLNFLVSAAGSDAPNIEEIQKKRAKERKEYWLKTRLSFL